MLTYLFIYLQTTHTHTSSEENSAFTWYILRGVWKQNFVSVFVVCGYKWILSELAAGVKTGWWVVLKGWLLVVMRMLGHPRSNNCIAKISHLSAVTGSQCPVWPGWLVTNHPARSYVFTHPHWISFSTALPIFSTLFWPFEVWWSFSKVCKSRMQLYLAAWL